MNKTEKHWVALCRHKGRLVEGWDELKQKNFNHCARCGIIWPENEPAPDEVMFDLIET